MIKDISNDLTIDTDKISVLARDENGFAVITIDGAKLRTRVGFEEIRNIMRNKTAQEARLAY